MTSLIFGEMQLFGLELNYEVVCFELLGHRQEVCYP